MMSINSSNQAFLQELRHQWNQNPVVATLNARLRPMEIPVEVMQISGNLQRRSQEEQERFELWKEVNNQVETQLRILGISGGGIELGVGWNESDPNDLMFYGTMAAIRASQANPQPVPLALESQAAAILQGRIDPMQVYILMGSQIPGYGQLPQVLQMLAAMPGGIPPIMKQLALVTAALTVPQYQIPELLADPRVKNPQPNALSGLLNILSNIFQ